MAETGNDDLEDTSMAMAPTDGTQPIVDMKTTETVNEQGSRDESGSSLKRKTTDRPKEGSKKKKKKSKDGAKQGGQYCIIDEHATEQARRQLRKEQRTILHDLKIGWGCSATENEAHMEADRKRHNDLFKRVQHPREFVLDADILNVRAIQLNNDVSIGQRAAYNPLTLAAKLKEKLTKKTAADDEKGRFDWTHLGHEAGACFRAVPSRVSFLLGPLQSQTMAKQRRPYKRRHVVKEEEPLEEQVLVPSDGKDCSAILDPAAPIKAVKKSLKEQCATAETGEIDMIPFLVNPNSFTQTVENFLNFSHLISKGLAGVRKDEVDGNRYIWYIGQQKDEKQKSKEDSGVVHSARQLVMPLTMRDWRKLVDAYNLKEGGLPNRDYSATAAGSVPSEKECNEKVSTVPKGQNQEEQKDGGQEDVAAR